MPDFLMALSRQKKEVDRMDQKSFYKLVRHLGAAHDAVDFVVKRADLVEWMRGLGYAERTIANHTYPSNKGGIIHRLLADGLIEDGGVKRWVVPSVSKLAEPRQNPQKKDRVRYFVGNPPEGGEWILSTRLDDGGEDDVVWNLYRWEYAPGRNNLKVVAMGRVPHKANYWIPAKGGKLVACKDAALLKTHRPDIYANLCEDVAYLFGDE
jgi:hypothetical protein